MSDPETDPEEDPVFSIQSNAEESQPPRSEPLFAEASYSTKHEEADSPYEERSASLLEVFFCGVSFLTRVPVPQLPEDIWQDAFKRSPLFFPLIGSLIGFCTFIVLFFCMQIWSIPIAVLLALAFELLLTGAFHEDALADFCDAFGGGWDREQILKIMKDSRLGTYGTLGLLTGVGLRYLLTVQLVSQTLSPSFCMIIIVAAAGFGRLGGVALMCLLKPVEHSVGLAKDISSQFSWNRFVWSAVYTIPVWFLFLVACPGAFVLSLLVGTMLLFVMSNYLEQKIDGTTGDCLGTVCFVGQVLMLLFVVGTKFS